MQSDITTRSCPPEGSKEPSRVARKPCERSVGIPQTLAEKGSLYACLTVIVLVELLDQFRIVSELALEPGEALS